MLKVSEALGPEVSGLNTEVHGSLYPPSTGSLSEHRTGPWSPCSQKGWGARYLRWRCALRGPCGGCQEDPVLACQEEHTWVTGRALLEVRSRGKGTPSVLSPVLTTLQRYFSKVQCCQVLIEMLLLITVLTYKSHLLNHCGKSLGNGILNIHPSFSLEN